MDPTPLGLSALFCFPVGVPGNIGGRRAQQRVRGAAVLGCSCSGAGQLFWGWAGSPLPGSAAIQLCWHGNCQGSATASQYTIPSKPRKGLLRRGGSSQPLPQSSLVSGLGVAGEGPAQPQGAVLVPSCLLDSRE